MGEIRSKRCEGVGITCSAARTAAREGNLSGLRSAADRIGCATATTRGTRGAGAICKLRMTKAAFVSMRGMTPWQRMALCNIMRRKAARWEG